MENNNQSPVQFEGTQPILCVEDMNASLHFYVDMLGFQNVSWGNDTFTSVSRGKVAIFLSKGGQGRGGAWVWVGVDDAEVLHAEYNACGVKIIMPPTNFAWALEFQVEDPDGNVLRIGSDPK